MPTPASSIPHRLNNVDYYGRRIYHITMTTEGRRPLLGTLTGNPALPPGSPGAPTVVPSALGQEILQSLLAIEHYHPQARLIVWQLMPDHLHFVLFITADSATHLGRIILGFKQGCNKAFRRVFPQGAPSGPPFGGAAIISQPQPLPPQPPQPQPPHHPRRPTTEERKHGLLWSASYYETPLSGRDQLERMIAYVRDNPRRLAIRRAHPDYFRVRFDISIGGQSYAAIGNRFLLSYPLKRQVQLSRRLTPEEIETKKDEFLVLASQGTVPVSPSISPAEQTVMRAVLDARLPLIFLTPWGFNSFSKPGHQFYDACADGRFLILAPWPHQNQRIPLTRAMCLDLNAMTKAICDGTPKV